MTQEKGKSAPALVGGCPMAWFIPGTGTAFVIEPNGRIFRVEAGYAPVPATPDAFQEFMRNRVLGQQLNEVSLPKDPHPYTSLQTTILEDYVRDTLLVLVRMATGKDCEMVERRAAVRQLEARIHNDRTLEALARAMVACDESPEEEAKYGIEGLPTNGRFGELVRKALEIGATAKTA